MRPSVYDQAASIRPSIHTVTMDHLEGVLLMVDLLLLVVLRLAQGEAGAGAGGDGLGADLLTYTRSWTWMRPA